MTQHDGYEIDLDALDEFVNSVQEFADNLYDKMSGVHTIVQALAERYRGEAMEAYERAHSEWQQGTREMHEGIEHLRGALATSHAAYAGVQALHKQMWPS